MSVNVRKPILKVKPYVPGKPIEEVKRELGLSSVIKLASNENPYGPSPKVLKAINKAAGEINRYPDASCYRLREALSLRLKVNQNQIIFGNGSDELICLAVRAFVETGDEVVIADPSFMIYKIASQIAGARIKTIPIKNFKYDLAAMKKAISPKTKIVFLGNPDNPAGTYFTEKEMKNFFLGLPSSVLVFIDEAYFEYVLAKDYVDSLKLLKTKKNIIVTRTFSKMYGLAGLRVGYGITSQETAGFLNRIREPFNVNTIAQAAALACLKDKAYYRQVALKVKAQREYLIRQFEKMGIKYQSSYTNFILVDVGQAKTVSKQLLKKGVIIRDMSVWGLNRYIRVTIGRYSENRRFIRALEDML